MRYLVVRFAFFMVLYLTMVYLWSLTISHLPTSVEMGCLVIVWSFALFLYLKREGEREWQRHQLRQRVARFHEVMDRVDAAMRTFGDKVNETAEVLRRLER